MSVLLGSYTFCCLTTFFPAYFENFSHEHVANTSFPSMYGPYYQPTQQTYPVAVAPSLPDSISAPQYQQEDFNAYRHADFASAQPYVQQNTRTDTSGWSDLEQERMSHMWTGMPPTLRFVLNLYVQSILLIPLLLSLVQTTGVHTCTAHNRIPSGDEVLPVLGRFLHLLDSIYSVWIRRLMIRRLMIREYDHICVVPISYDKMAFRNAFTGCVRLRVMLRASGPWNHNHKTVTVA